MSEGNSVPKLHKLTKTQTDRLGERLRKGNFSDADLIALDEYRRSFGGAYQAVVGTVRETLGLEPTGRPAKSTGSTVEKLRRESIRLTQIQDIAGCRLVVAGIVEQEQVVSSLRNQFPETSVMDRREKPTHGYRAVHVIPKIEGKPVEIQVRTALQHLWAELSEKLSDVLDPAIKYGGGDMTVRDALVRCSALVGQHENIEQGLAQVEGKWKVLPEEERRLLRMKIDSAREDIVRGRNTLEEKLRVVVEIIAKIGRTIHDFPG